MSAKLVDVDFSHLVMLLDEEKQIATEFLRATVAMHDHLCSEEVEQVAVLLDERKLCMERADDVRVKSDLLFLSLRASLSEQGLLIFGALKEEIALIWQEARDKDKIVADKMHTLLVDLKLKLKQVDRNKKVYRAYAETERHAPK